ncbi:ArnT family glycosyltransferase [Alicyclobacillus ferrooxydans]|uniref:Uncharacterized protein n=1 Tax=Alicyclobacillus ferrooxydans TaxID=471514 RepID=A0A0P9CR54_9BACL|nr:glycosyltransferase family 39 protein [Alicyclobacillus ferrooxydans]KPV41852.1 hypothetical protein AN477_20300 [Alicyclobacillus ferrooxydans]
MVLILGLALTVASAYVWSRSLFIGRLDALTGAMVFFFAQTMMVVWISGVPLHALYTGTVLVVSAVFAALALVTYRATRHNATRFKPDTNATPRQLPMAAPMKIERTGYAAIVLLIVLLLFALWLGYLLPPYFGDELGYHLVSVAYWAHQHAIAEGAPGLWPNVYPRDAELFYSFIYTLSGGTVFIHLSQWFFALGAAVAIIGCARRIGLSRTGGLVAATLFVGMPNVLMQATTAYVDLAFATCFLLGLYFALAYLKTPSWKYALAAGVGAGMSLGIKADGALYVGILALVMLGFAIERRRRAQANSTAVLVLCDAGVFTAALLVFGLYWYVKVWMTYGSPLYPFTFRLFGHTVFPGLYTLQNQVIQPNEPVKFRGSPEFMKTWVAWTSLPQEMTTDMHVGAFGPVWTYLEMPGLFAFTLWTALRRRRLFLGLTLPLWLIFVFQPANWWGRYTLSFGAFGVIAFAWIAEQIGTRPHWRWVGKLLPGLALVGVVGTYGAGAAIVTKVKSMNVSSSAYSSITTHRSPMSLLELSLSLSPAKRTSARLFYPPYRFVDQLASPVTIAYTPNVPYPYLFFGQHAQNRVLEIHASNGQKFYREVSQDRINYLMAASADKEYKYVAAAPREFHPIEKVGGYLVVHVIRRHDTPPG